MLNPSQSGEKRIASALNWMHEIDQVFECLREEQPELYARRGCISFELMLHRKLNYLRTYDRDKGVVVTLHPNSVVVADLDLSLIWAVPGKGPFMHGLLHWSGPLPGSCLTLGKLTEAPSWEWSVHT